MKRFLFPALAAVILGGCTHAPSRQEIANADFGRYPENYKAIVEAFMSQRLKDPDSARYDYLGTPTKGWYPYSTAYGYIICVNINARNSYGGYTGFELSYFMIKNGRIIANSNSNRSRGDSFERDLCEKTL